MSRHEIVCPECSSRKLYATQDDSERDQVALEFMICHYRTCFASEFLYGPPGLAASHFFHLNITQGRWAVDAMHLASARGLTQ